MSQIDTENDKNYFPIFQFSIFQFSKILCICFPFLTEFVDWNVKKVQQEKMLGIESPVGFFEEFIAVV